MFAFAVWDTSRRRLVLGRDRMGKKPLYYWSNGHSIVFASEIKALLVHPDVPKRMNSAALPGYLVFGYVPTPETFFEGIRSVPPAHVLVFEPGSSLRLERYWEPVVPADGQHVPMSLDEAAMAVRRALSLAVERRLVGDVPVGAFLSGGLDSSTVVALWPAVPRTGWPRLLSVSRTHRVSTSAPTPGRWPKNTTHGTRSWLSGPMPPAS